MKKIIAISIVFIALIVGLLFIKRDSFNNGKNIINKDIKKIAIVSDLHLQDYDDSSNDFLIDVILDDISKSDIDLLILLGDNTNSGKANQHEELINRLNKYKNQFDILVTIGNHDLGKLSINEYRELYKTFGYDTYYSKDKHSLSYSTIYNNLKLIMLDTGGYLDYSSEPSISKKTISWFINELKDAKENNYEVLCFGHYPIITPQPSAFKEKGVLKSLLLEFKVPLYAAGHLHGHSVNKIDTLSELVVERGPDYPISYEVLTIKNDSYDISTKYPDVEEYARDNNIKEDRYLNFNDYSESEYKSYTDEIIDIMAKDKDLSDNELIMAKDLFNLIMKHLKLGDLVDYVSYINGHEAKKYLDYIIEGSNYEAWLPKVLNSANEYTKGFVIKK